MVKFRKLVSKNLSGHVASIDGSGLKRLVAKAGVETGFSVLFVRTIAYCFFGDGVFSRQ